MGMQVGWLVRLMVYISDQLNRWLCLDGNTVPEVEQPSTAQVLNIQQLSRPSTTVHVA